MLSARLEVIPRQTVKSGRQAERAGARGDRILYLHAMRLLARVFCLSLLSVALFGSAAGANAQAATPGFGGAQPRTVNGCKIKHHTVCHHKDLHGKDLHGAVLHHSVLHHINLRKANLRRADLRYADLRKADLRGADLRGANLKGAKLNQYTAPKKKGAPIAKASECYPTEPVSPTNCEEPAPSCYPKCSGANLTYANLSGAFLNGADLTNSTLTDASLTSASLAWANLSNSYAQGVDLTYASLVYANLDSADLRYANLSYAWLWVTNFHWTALTQTVFFNTTGCATVIPAGVLDGMNGSECLS